MPDVSLHLGDCLKILPTLGHIDAVVTDPPSGISFMSKSWDTFRSRDAFVNFLTPRLIEAFRVAKPGARSLVWALPRTSHWTATAIEDAGWIIEDRISHIFGQGFPKAKSKLKPAVEDWYLARKPSRNVPPLNIDECRINPGELVPGGGNGKGNYRYGDSAHCTSDRPVVQPHALGRWPANLVIGHHPDCKPCGMKRVRSGIAYEPSPKKMERKIYGETNTLGRECGYADSDGMETVQAWECVDGCPVAMLDEQSGTLTSGKLLPHHTDNGKEAGRLGSFRGLTGRESYGDSGGASRFFYCPKASRSDRGPDNDHPTVKNADLMRWLIRLITQPNDVVLDPFMGSGSTGKAAILEGRSFIGIEQDPTDFAIAERRIAAARAEQPLFA